MSKEQRITESPHIPDERTDLEACMTCLDDHAALLLKEDPENEMGDTMLTAEALMREMSCLLIEVAANFTRDDDLPDNLLGRIHSILYRN